MDYDFSQLNDKEFEVLVNDLLSTLLETRIERFKTGRDGGVDGRFFSDETNEVVIQTKHYIKSGLSMLMSTLRKELPKVSKLNPSQYLVVTSVPLSRKNKQDIMRILFPYVKSEDDIFGPEDLNDILAQNKHIEEKHFKLWISSTAVFQRLLNNAIKGRSQFEIESIKIKSAKYVLTSNHVQALDILEKNHAIIISGEPGIGKTTLAENLCLFYASKGYEFLDIEESLTEAEAAYDRERPQVFYFDDFLGSNYFEAIENKKDSHITKFIERIRNDRSKRFILTSRTNILTSGIHHSSLFANENIKKDEFLLKINTLSDLEKGTILYNHIWFSDLDEVFIDEIYKHKRYLNIIKHKNFNPRLIEFITDTGRINVRSNMYWDFISNTLNNPKDIWEHCLNIQSNPFIRSLVLLIVFNGSSMVEGELHASYDKLLSLENLTSSTNTDKSFNSIVKLATQSFLNRNMSSNSVSYSLFNPSIADYILHEYCDNKNKLIALYRSFKSITSLRTLRDLNANGAISGKNHINILETLFSNAFNDEHSYDYLIFICHALMEDSAKAPGIVKVLDDIISAPNSIEELNKFIELLEKFDPNIEDYSFLPVIFTNRYIDFDELEKVLAFTDKNQINCPELYAELESQLSGYLAEEANEIEGSIELSEFFTISQSNEGDFDQSIDEEGLIGEFEFAFENSLSNLTYDVIGKLNINTRDIASDLDFDAMINNYIRNAHGPDYDRAENLGNSMMSDDINDLFERS